MGYVFLGAVGLFLAWWGVSAFSKLRPATRGQMLRWGVGGLLAVATVGLAFARRMDIAVFSGAAALSILRFGRLGPFNLGGATISPQNISKVQSRYFAMELDHDSGTVSGKVIDGRFRGRDLIELDEAETRLLLEEITANPDSVSLLESWLDANRKGWREYFEETAQQHKPTPPPANAEAEAYAVLGLKPGATAEQVKAAHRELIKGVHPDHGGSSFLAARINEARDLLLRSMDEKR